MGLDKTHVRYSPLSGNIYIARFGNDPTVALETKDVTGDFLRELAAYAFGGVMPGKGEAAEVKFGGGDEQFTMTITRDNAPHPPTETNP